jgi:hypothetical protein
LPRTITVHTYYCYYPIAPSPIGDTRYGVEEKQVKQFERLLVGLDHTIMKSQVLQNCIEQVTLSLQK